MIIKINVANKHPTVEGSPVIVCSNNDYVIQFTFDEEWDTSEVKTARFVWSRAGKLVHKDLPLFNNMVEVPILSGVSYICVGVYAGDLHTTTPARIECEYSILCESGQASQENAPGVPDSSDYFYTKADLDPIIMSADERLTILEETAARSIADFEAIVPPLVERVDTIVADAGQVIADFAARISALEAMPIYEGEVEDL